MLALWESSTFPHCHSPFFRLLACFLLSVQSLIPWSPLLQQHRHPTRSVYFLKWLYCTNWPLQILLILLLESALLSFWVKVCAPVFHLLCLLHKLSQGLKKKKTFPKIEYCKVYKHTKKAIKVLCNIILLNGFSFWQHAVFLKFKRRKDNKRLKIQFQFNECVHTSKVHAKYVSNQWERLILPELQ